MVASNYKLRYCKEGGEWQEFPINKDKITLGRTTECDIVLDNKKVSRLHAVLTFENNAFFLTDVKSANGVLLNGKAIPPQQPVPLTEGQSFTIANFTFLLAGPPQPTQFSRPQAEGLSSRKPSYTLSYRLKESPWQEFPLIEQDTVIGRAPDCSLQLDLYQVSRHHARLSIKPDGIWLTDLGSSNGTQIGGNPLSPRKQAPLPPGQLFTISEFTLKVEERAASGLISSPILPPSTSPSAPERTIIAPPVQKALAAPYSVDLSTHDHVSIGRAQDNDLILNHPIVSSYHAEIERLGTRFRLRDLRSTNGVFVNGGRVEQEAWLKDNDAIQIGPYILNLSGQNLRGRADTGITLEARNLNQRVSKQLNLLKNLNLSIKPMEFVALVGMSGSGKSTLLNALSGYRPATDGMVSANGVNLYKHYDAFRNDIGYVPQKDIVHAELTPATALEYVARLRMPADTTPEERRKAVLEVLEDLDLTERKDIPISRLSGGQLKRVSIGVELLTKPRLFFLDEPTSGLDPGTEYEMMKLMRRLADQGRTVILVTHATKNVSFCDKVIFLARGGHLAFFGPPEEALSYFDGYRSSREHQQKEMEFDDIYRILNDEKRGSPSEWGKRFLESPAYATYCAPAVRQGAAQPVAQGPAGQRSGRARVSTWHQFLILSSRNLKILVQDKVSLALMLALAPAIGLMDFIWGTKLFDPVNGDASKIITMWFMTALITVLVGALSSVREIVKEIDIYKRERAVNLKILPYILSKVWVGFVLALYQAAVLLLTRTIAVQLKLPATSDYFALYITLFLGTLCGYLIGLMISASAPNQNSAMMLIIVALVPQFLFAGALLPLNLIPGGEAISLIMPTRWSFEALIRVTGLGEELSTDPCYELSKSERARLTEEQKAACPCMGVNIFTYCTDFPGILSEDYYDTVAQQMLSQPKPQEPGQPTPYPYPTAFPSPTALPTPTLLPTLTPFPMPSNPALMQSYMDQSRDQGQVYQNMTLDQFTEYRADSQYQGDVYSQLRTQQGDEYAALRQIQGDEYKQAMQAYGDERANWQESREKAISSAEALLETTYDNYGRAFRGTVISRWFALTVIMAVLTVLVTYFQKRKDVV
jgi:ABC-type multidrug transport system ATPase subunit/pSer/pThr/pTyr-binding forkhead associated (FHA) protein